MKKRILACLLMMCMLVTMLPATAFAAEYPAVSDNQTTSEIPQNEQGQDADTTGAEESDAGDAVFWNPYDGSDDQDGSSENTAVKTLGKAQELLAQRGLKLIYLTNAYTVTEKESWDLAGATIQRYGIGGAMIIMEDNRGPKGIISRELVKETLHEDTNEYKKLANISLDRGSGVFSYDNLEADPNVDALSCCQDAQELFALYQTCASRRQIDTLLQNYLDTMQAVKAARGRIYFIPRDYMPKLALFEDFIALLEQHNQHKYADRLPLDANSMFVVDDEKQRSKMALAFYRTIQKDLAEYEKRATHLIQSGNQSPAIMDRMVLSIRELERKKIYYESILKQELHEVDEQYTSLRYLSDELQIRARSIQAQKRLAA